MAFHGSDKSINVNGILIFIPRGMKLVTQGAGESYFSGEKKVVFKGCSE